MGAGGPDVRLVGERAHALDEAERAWWASVATHTHVIRGPRGDHEAIEGELVAWCARHGIDAAGLGSPWEPVSAASYARFEGPERDRYYAGMIDPASVMDREAIMGFFERMNRAAIGRTLFYPENETPKGRLGHLWYFGFRYLVPAWHDYSQDRPVQYCDDDPPDDPNALAGAPHRRRSCLAVVQEQRRAGALAVWAHPTSWWWEPEGEGKRRFVTNIAAECPVHLVADGYLDGFTVMGYDACHRWYQRLWFRLLDTGATVPCFAETDACFGRHGAMEGETVLTNWLPVRRGLDRAFIVGTARTGRCFAGTGAFLTIAVDGAPMGSVVETARGRSHRVVVEAHPVPGEDGLSRVDLVGRGGDVLCSRERFPGGTIELEVGGSAGPAWLVARAFGHDDDPDAPRQRDIRHMAITNPVYLRPRGHREGPASTDIVLDFREASPWIGARVEFRSASGDVLESARARPGALRAEMPANVEVVISAPEGGTKRFHPAFDNPATQSVLRYLAYGDFLRDWPGLSPGEVPPEAFRLRELAAALGSFRRVL